MTRIKLAALLALGALVSACGTTAPTSLDAPFEAGPLPLVEPAANAPTDVPIADEALTDVRVTDIAVRVPRSLTVSEANRYLPSGDIVWRGDPIGDRHQQVADIFNTAMQRGTADLDGARPVSLDIEVKYFHALTEKARYTVGGVHSIAFVLTLRDPATGSVIGSPREVRADLDAYGGQRALEAEAAGQTQKVRITAHLADVILQELTQEGGFENPQLGLFQALQPN